MTVVGGFECPEGRVASCVLPGGAIHGTTAIARSRIGDIVGESLKGLACACWTAILLSASRQVFAIQAVMIQSAMRYPFRSCLLVLLAFSPGCDYDDVGDSDPPDARYCAEMIEKMLVVAQCTAEELRESDPKMHDALQSFRNYPALAESVERSSVVSVYEGLPHPTWERELFAAAQENQSTVVSRGFLYYESPISLSEDDSTLVRDLFGQRNWFHPKIGYPACGGYHPDWRIVFQTDDQTIEMELCFGCGEMKVFAGATKMYCSIDEAPFKKILMRYHRNRPDR